MTQISIRLPAYYKENMVLQQGVINRIYGQTQANSEITLLLERFPVSSLTKKQGKKASNRLRSLNKPSYTRKDDESIIVFSDKEETDSKGFFKFHLPIFEGSHDYYRLSLRLGKQACVINKIYFGEVWLAIGESNMSMPSRYTDVKEDIEEYASLRNLHFYTMAEYGLADDEENFLYQPTGKIVDGQWLTPNKENFLDVSAIALSFAGNLQKSLKFPVAVYDLAASDTMLHSWLPRDVIENNQIIKDHLIQINHYRDEYNWNQERENEETLVRQVSLDSKISVLPKKDIFTKKNQPAAMFNHKLAALSGLAIRGVLFSHGESDVNYPEYYLRAFKAFVQVVKEQFYSFKRGPYLLYSQLAPHYYCDKDDKFLAYFNETLTIARRQLSIPAGMVTLYDLPLDYHKSADHKYARPLNPIAKAAIGFRMCQLAQGLVYQREKPKSATEVKYAEWIADKLILSFNNVGSGLSLPEEDLTLKGFNICKKDSPYLPAEANKLFGIRTLIWHPEISEPLSCSYAFSTFNQSANLKSGDGMPVVPFRLEKDQPDNSLKSEWMYCDKLSGWIVPTKDPYQASMSDHEKAGYFPLWQVSQGNAKLALEKTNKRSSSGALLIHYEKADKKPIVFEPILHYASLYPPLDISFWKYLEIEVFNADHIKKRISLYLEDSAGNRAKSEIALIDDILAWQKISFIIEKMPVDLSAIVALQFILESNSPKGELTLDSVKCTGIREDIAN